MERYRLRYAPSPTGFLHIGNTRTALMDYLFAKHYGGTFIVRIEDTDLERNVEGALESQFDNLHWLGIIPDESYLTPGLRKYGQYKQSEKFPLYQKFAHYLVKKGTAYFCFCTAEELEIDYQIQTAQGIVATKYNRKCLHLTPMEIEANLKAKKPYVIRFQVPDQSWTINDLVRGEVTFQGKDLGDFVILKANGIATYNFAVVVDDHDMEITHVVRGEEHISNTPRQMMIYDAFNWQYPIFCHLTLIVDQTGKKLSKRSGNNLFFISQYRQQGYFPEAIFNYIALLGWSPKGEQEILSPGELITMFDEKRFTKAPSTFDMVKMKWINAQYMKKISDEEYLNFVKQFIHADFQWKDQPEVWINAVLLLYKKEIEYGMQINDHLALFFQGVQLDDLALNDLKELTGYEKLIEIFTQKIQNLKTWNVEEIKRVIQQSGQETQCQGKNLYMPIRIFTTKSLHGPALGDVIFLLGLQTVLTNITTVERQIIEERK
jgi:nondiscriminating glutamyl-tRNA synthetase